MAEDLTTFNFQLPKRDKAWLMKYAKHNHIKPAVIGREMVRDYRAKVEAANGYIVVGQSEEFQADGTKVKIIMVRPASEVTA
jgi:hypothetical protein